MPITSVISLNLMEQEEFARLDYQAMRRAFESQNELGRYERQLRSLLRVGPLRALQWVNLARQRVQLVSLIKGDKVRKMESEK